MFSYLAAYSLYFSRTDYYLFELPSNENSNCTFDSGEGLQAWLVEFHNTRPKLAGRWKKVVVRIYNCCYDSNECSVFLLNEKWLLLATT